MKNFSKQILGLAMIGMILGGCSQTGTFEDADLTNELAAADKAGFKLSPYSVGGNENARAFATDPDCETECLEKNSEYVFSESYTTGIIGNSANNKRIDATVSLYIGADNMAYYRIDYSVTRTAGSSNADTFIFGVLNGEAFGSSTTRAGKLGDNNGVVSKSFETALFDYTTITCGETFSFLLTEISVQGNGILSDTNSLLAYCPESCDESFDYVDNEDGSYTFTYIPDADVKGADLVFTFAQNSVKTGQDGWSVAGQTYQKTIDLTACKEYNWTFTLDCKDLTNVQNLWTDFKVNGASKKGSLSNIKCE